MIDHSLKVTDYQPASPQGLIPFRSFAAAMCEFSDFDKFRQALIQVVKEDSGYAGILELDADIASMHDSDVGQHFQMDSLVVPLSAGHDTGYIRFAGNDQGRAFDAGDLMWMGAISEFVSLAYANAKMHRDSQNKARIFQYLINQLPLGVLCFDAQRNLIVENELASRLLGTNGASLLRDMLTSDALQNKLNARLHLEIDGRLIYAEARCLDVAPDLAITAYMLHDLNGQQEKLMLQLERAVYRAESRGAHLSVVVLEDRSEPGRLLQELKASAVSLQLEPAAISSLDAYTCICIFTEKHVRSVRYLLKKTLGRLVDRESVMGALMSDLDSHTDTPAQTLIESARANMQALHDLLRPAILVLDPYPAVIESLDLIAGDICCFQRGNDIESSISRLQSGEFDGIFLDIDNFGSESREWMNYGSEQADASFKIFYMTHKQPLVVVAEYELGDHDFIFQKPFDVEALSKTLKLQFDFA